MMGYRSAKESRYQAILSGEGCMKALFKTIKAAANGQGLARVFITGVSPVAMSDLTSAYNVAENIYLLPHFNALCGFREADYRSLDSLPSPAASCSFFFNHWWLSRERPRSER